MDQVTAGRPVGVGVEVVANQAAVVNEAVGGFTKALFEAVLIVMVVSFVSLGLRAGLVVACAIPLTLALVFVFMEYSGITMHRISLGALIIVLGLLVDDAMITVEMMVTRLEPGDSLHDAASFAYTSTAFPMLTGTLVTVAGFVCSRTIPTCCAGALMSVAARSVFTPAMLSLRPMGGGPAAGPYH